MSTQPTSPDGSVLRRESPRRDLLAFEIRKKITKSDMEWMSHVVDRAFDAHDEVDMLLIMTNYEGAELGALFDGDAMSVQARSNKHVRRYAVVGAPAWASAMINVFGSVSPVETNTFGLEEEASAWTWVSAGAATSRTT